MKLIARFLLLALAVLVASYVVPGVVVTSLTTALIMALVLALLNMTLKPILFILTLPITLLTLGLFALILNALILWLAAGLVPGVSIAGFVPALLASLIISLVTWVGHKLLP